MCLAGTDGCPAAARSAGMRQQMSTNPLAGRAGMGWPVSHLDAIQKCVVNSFRDEE